MNGLPKSHTATFAALAATAAFLFSGGVWLGNLQTRVDEHANLLAHSDADKRLDRIEKELVTLHREIRETDNLLHNLITEEQQRHEELLEGLRRMEWHPLKEE